MEALQKELHNWQDIDPVSTLTPEQQQLRALVVESAQKGHAIKPPSDRLLTSDEQSDRDVIIKKFVGGGSVSDLERQRLKWLMIKTGESQAAWESTSKTPEVVLESPTDVTEVPAGIALADGRLLSRGDRVVIHRSDGSIENDWILTSFGRSKVVVVRREPGSERALQKVIALEEFQSWQDVSDQQGESVAATEEISAPEALRINTLTAEEVKQLVETRRQLGQNLPSIWNSLLEAYGVSEQRNPKNFAESQAITAKGLPFILERSETGKPRLVWFTGSYDSQFLANMIRQRPNEYGQYIVRYFEQAKAS